VRGGAVPISGSPAIQPNVTSGRKRWTTPRRPVLRGPPQGYVSRHKRQADRALKLAWVRVAAQAAKSSISTDILAPWDAQPSYGRIDDRVVWNTLTLDFPPLAGELRGSVVES
jgi:hypothetical protein